MKTEWRAVDVASLEANFERTNYILKCLRFFEQLISPKTETLSHLKGTLNLDFE